MNEKITYLDGKGKPCAKDQAVVIEKLQLDPHGKPLKAHYVIPGKDLSVKPPSS